MNFNNLTKRKLLSLLKSSETEKETLHKQILKQENKIKFLSEKLENYKKGLNITNSNITTKNRTKKALSKDEKLLFKTISELENKVNEKDSELISLNELLNSEIKSGSKIKKQLVDVRTDRFEFSKDLCKIQENERRRIARDLHDSISQYLTSAKMLIASVGPVNDMLAQRLGRILNLIETAKTEINNVSYNLHPIVLDDHGFLKALIILCNQFKERTKIDVDLESYDLPERLPEKYEINLYRVFQELFNNVEKHSKATKVKINFNLNEKSIKIGFSDNGIGFYISPDEQKITFGLRNLVERISFLSGMCDIVSEINKGTNVNILIPFKIKISSNE